MNVAVRPAGAARVELAPEATGYRADVDGLRAVAVLAVVLFHAGVPFLEGGFVGVDVFFVISGYLITRQIHASAVTDGFSFREFYLRRVRRLLPAATATIAATVLAGVVLLPPMPLERLAMSAVAASVSLSNFYFSDATGYWAPAATELPLLHTWSLGVEEQFYLVWPVVVLALLRWRSGRFAGQALVLMAAVSVVATTVLTAVAPAWAFYLAPARAYEFALGALCVWWLRAGRVREASSSVRTALRAVGLGLIAAAVLTFDEALPFPSFTALVPTVGAVLVILAGSTDRSGLLGSRPLVAVGLRSYSLYLVHWPVLVLWGLVDTAFTVTDVVLALVLAAALTEVQYRGIERRFRLGSRPPATGAGAPRGPEPGRRWLRLGGPAVATALAVAAISGAVVVTDGLLQRFEPSLRPLASMTVQDVNVDRRAISTRICGDATPVICGGIVEGRPNILIVGDSHTDDGVNIVAAAAPEANLLVAGRPGCPFHLATEVVDDEDRECRRLNESRIAAIEELAASSPTVVLSNLLLPRRLATELEVISWLRGLGLRVIVLGVGLSHDTDIRDLVLMEGRDGAATVLTERADDRLWPVDASYREATEEAGASYLGKLDWLCPGGACSAFVPGTEDLVVFDHGHMTAQGATAFGRAISGRLARLLEPGHDDT